MVHGMQRGGELAGLEGVVLLWGTERTYVFAAPSQRKALERFREVKQRLEKAHGSKGVDRWEKRLDPHSSPFAFKAWRVNSRALTPERLRYDAT